jgi:hypothetical protein
MMMGCYRLGEVGDPETYFTAVIAVLLRYPPDVITAVTEPATGIPSKVKWLPTIAEIVEACDLALAPVLRQRERDRVVASHRLAAPAPPKLSEAELDAQFERAGLAHLRPGSKCDTRRPRSSLNEAMEAQATLDRYAAEAQREPAREAAE